MTDSAADPIERARSEGRDRLLEVEAKRLLADAGVPVPDHVLASSPDAAVEAAERIGYPVVLKVSAPAVQHKSEWADGAGVALDLADAASTRTAADRILEAGEERGVDADVLVEAAADTGAGTEVIVGGVRDPSFGPTLTFGLGGVFTEVLRDTSTRLAPVSTAEALAMVGDVDGARLLDGYRGRPAADREALAEVVATVGDLLAEREALAELEVNPLLAGPGSDVVALDALATLR